MPEHIKRMLQESEELIDKLNKAIKFFEKERDSKEDERKLDLAQLANLYAQITVMTSYIKILKDRINYDTKKEMSKEV